MLGIGAGGPTGGGAAASSRTAVPRSLSEREAWAVVTSVSGLGPVGFATLLGRYGSAAAILDAARKPGGWRGLVAAGIDDGRQAFGQPVAEALAAVARDPSGPLERIVAAGVAVVTLDDPAYPPRLRSIAMPPHVLYVSGDLAALSTARAVAVVGTRRPTEMGRLVAARIGAALGQTGAAVVSGLAVGIDGAAQSAVLHEHGTTVAVLGSGHSRLYPRAHANLAARIVGRNGAVVSEMPPDIGPTAGTFPRRNRLISGLADATIVVEAGTKSGALITAGWALEQGRDCYMVPGPIDSPQSRGCLAWLREFPGQVRIVAGIPELVEDLGLFLGEEDDDRRDGGSRPRPPSLDAELVEVGATARSVAVALVRGRGTIDELVAVTGHAVATVLGALTLLEMRGLATSAYGRYRPAGRLAAANLRESPAA